MMKYRRGCFFEAGIDGCSVAHASRLFFFYQEELIHKPWFFGSLRFAGSSDSERHDDVDGGNPPVLSCAIAMCGSGIHAGSAECIPGTKGVTGVGRRPVAGEARASLDVRGADPFQSGLPAGQAGPAGGEEGARARMAAWGERPGGGDDLPIGIGR